MPNLEFKRVKKDNFLCNMTETVESLEFLLVDLYVTLTASAVLLQTFAASIQFFTLGLKLQERFLHVAHQLQVLGRKHKTEQKTE